MKDFTDVSVLDAIDVMLKKANNAYEALVNCARYAAILTMRDRFESVLTDIYNDSTNPKELRQAAYECIEIMNAGCAAALLKLVNDEFVEEDEKIICGFVFDQAWNALLKQLPGLGGASLAIMGVRFITNNFAFDMDGIVATYYQLEVHTKVEKALCKIVKNSEVDYMRYENKKNADMYVGAMKLYEEAFVKGYDYVATFYTLIEMEEDSINGILAQKAAFREYFNDFDLAIDVGYKDYIKRPTNILRY